MTVAASAIELNNHRRVTWFVLIVLLLLRIPFITATIYFMPIEDESGATFYEVVTYFLIAFLIWWERDSLTGFHMDTPTLFFIIFFRPLQTLILGHWGAETPLAFPQPAALMIWTISIGLLFALWHSGYKPTRFTTLTFSWLSLGLFVGVLVSVLENLKPFQSAFKNNFQPLPLTPLFTSTGLNLLYHLSVAPISEEPLFRGFLWGCLRQLKWRELWIWLFQAALFTSAHIYFAVQSPLMFWLFIPGAALVLGLFAWRSRSLAPGMLMHGFINGSAYMLALGIYTYFL